LLLAGLVRLELPVQVCRYRIIACLGADNYGVNDMTIVPPGCSAL